MSFVTAFVRDAALLLLFTVPLLVVARRSDRWPRARSFVIAAVVVAVFTAVTSAGSNRLAEDCLVAGNTACDDIGGAGVRFVLLGGYIVVVLIAAGITARE